MKALISSLCLFLFFFTSVSLWAADGNDRGLTPAKILEEIKAAKTSEEIEGLAKRILETQNLELYVAGRRASPDLANELYKGSQSLPESSFLDEIVLMLMRKPWLFDDAVEKNIQGSFPYPSMQTFCIRVIRTRLKGESLEIEDEKSIDRLSRFAARQELADKFEAAIRPPQASVPPKEKTAPMASPQSPGNEATDIALMPTVDNTATAPSPPHPIGLSKIGWAAIAAAVLGILWWTFRRRNK